MERKGLKFCQLLLIVLPYSIFGQNNRIIILIAYGGATKADWIAVNSENKEAFRARPLGVHPAFVSEEELNNQIINRFQLLQYKK
jgi:hypothetical protein